jgi:hypothetical protein
MSYRQRTLQQILDLQQENQALARENQALAAAAAQAAALAAECERLRAANALLELEVSKLLRDKQALAEELLELRTLLAFMQGEYDIHPMIQVRLVRRMGLIG